MLLELKKLQKEVANSTCRTVRQQNKKDLLIHAINCAIDEEERMDAMVKEYEERFKWV